jgi:hypothetical protein
MEHILDFGRMNGGGFTARWATSQGENGGSGYCQREY